MAFGKNVRRILNYLILSFITLNDLLKLFLNDNIIFFNQIYLIYSIT